MDKLTGQFGALGNWEKIAEQFDSTIIKQTNDASCVAAVGEMLADFYGLKLTQAEILESIGIWSNADALAEFLNSKETQVGVEWIGGSFPLESKYIKGISIDIWGAMLRQGGPIGHAVLISGIDESGLIIVKDPFDQTRYKMTDLELYDVLSEFVLRRRKQR